MPCMRLWMGSLLIICTACSESSPSELDHPLPQSITFSSADDTIIYGTYYPVADAKPPGMALVHMLRSNRQAWESFAMRAQAAGIATLAIDMRGHGESVQRGTDILSYSEFDTADWERVMLDIDAALDELRARGADPDNLALVGASIGGNLSLRYAATHPEVQALILLSPGSDYRGIEIKDDLKAYGRRPIMLVVAEGDAYSVTSVRELDAIAPGLCEIREYPGAAHGSDIFMTAEGAEAQALLWLHKFIGPDRTP